MHRESYRAQMSGLRRQLRQASPRIHTIIGGFNAGDVLYSVSVKRDHNGSWVEMRTARLSERPRRALASDALLWAANYRLAAKGAPWARARNLEAARACVREAAAYSSAFNRLP